MIIMRQVEKVEHVSTEYNEYVPLTAMWRNASEVLESPVYVVWRETRTVTWSSNSIPLQGS